MYGLPLTSLIISGQNQDFKIVAGCQWLLINLTVISYAAYGQITPNSQKCHLADSVRSVSRFYWAHMLQPL